MSQTKKAVILFLALLLPVAIFVFLKFQGKNEFEVKPLFQEPVKPSTQCSLYPYKTPYVISDTLLTDVWSDTLAIRLIVFEDSLSDMGRTTMTQIDRIVKETSLDRVFLLAYKVNSMDNNFIRNCILLMEPKHNAVLVDNNRRIMGQYDLHDLDEADRLIMETKIILKEY